MTGRRYNTKGTGFSVEDSGYADDIALAFEDVKNLALELFY